MKKLLPMLLALAILVSMTLVACGGGNAGDDDSDDVKSAALLIGQLGDKSFSDIIWSGFTEIESRHGDKISVKAVEYGNDKAKIQPSLLDSAENYDMVFFWGPEILETCEEIADQFSDTWFVCIDISPDTQTQKENIAYLYFAQNEGDYLAGLFAINQSQTGVIGFVGGQEAPVINDFLAGYIEGATDANANAKVAVSYIQNYTDSAKGKELSMVQYNQFNADILHQVAGGAGLGVLEAASEIDEENVWAIGVDSDQRQFFIDTKKEIADRIITSCLKRVDIAVIQIIEDALESNFEYFGKLTTMGIAEDVTVIVEDDFYKANATEAAQKAVTEGKEAVKNGTKEVPCGFLMSQDEINAMRNKVAP